MRGKILKNLRMGISDVSIYREFFSGEDYNLYKPDGNAKLQRAEHEIEAAIGFLESITSAEKNRKQLGCVGNASPPAGWLTTP